MEKKIAELRRRLDDFYEASITVKGDTSEILNKLLEKVAGILHGKFILVEYRQGNEFIFKASYNLPEELKLEALETARAISSEGARAVALSCFAAHLPEELKQYTLENYVEIASSLKRSVALKTLLTLIGALTRPITRGDVVNICKTIRDVGQWWP